VTAMPTAMAAPAPVYMNRIRPRLWLGSLEAVDDVESLRAHNISHILTCGRFLTDNHQSDDPRGTLAAQRCVSLRELGIQMLPTLQIDDLDEVDILEHLPTTSDQIRDALADGASGVLVHCASGKSRSASVLIAYLMRHERLAYTVAFQQVKDARPVIAPNTGFVKQLAWYGENGCPQTLREVGSGAHYTELPVFVKLLRRYTAGDVVRLVEEAGLSATDDFGEGGGDDAAVLSKQVLVDVIAALDQLQSTIPADDEARVERKRQTSRASRGLDALLSDCG